MAEQKFENGAKVKLKSGGPIMTVVGYDRYQQFSQEEQYKCRWFDGKNNLTDGYFTEPELELASAPTSASVRLERA